jgi:hypothetical protein
MDRDLLTPVISVVGSLLFALIITGFSARRRAAKIREIERIYADEIKDFKESLDDLDKE